MLITNWTYGAHRDVAAGPEARSAWWSVDDIGDAQSRDAWREAFGTFQWDHLRDERACLLVSGDDITDASNTFNEALLVRTRLGAYAYLLNRPWRNSGGVMWMVSGTADPSREPRTLRTFAQLPEFFFPYFVNRPAFTTAMSQYSANNWIDDWCDDFASLDAARGNAWLISPPVEMAVLSFFDASSSAFLDFRMPALVRAIESLVAIPRGQGQQMFAARAALFATSVQGHPGVVAAGRPIGHILADLYQLRSDAVHGKWPLREMQDAQREDDVAVLDFVAEGVVRAIIKWAIRNRAAFTTLTTRAALENAWINGTIPPP